MWWYCCLVLLLTLILLYLKYRQSKPQFTPVPVKTMVILGSGGHTKEILSIAETLPRSIYSPRIYVHSQSDLLSRDKAVELESKGDSCPTDYDIWSIYRSREVGQSWISSCFTTFVSSLHAILVLFRVRPRFILCNGPGVCVPLCAVAFVSTKLGLLSCTIVYVESICRVKTISLSGKILRHFVDKFFVQWHQQVGMYPGSTFIGRLS